MLESKSSIKSPKMSEADLFMEMLNGIAIKSANLTDYSDKKLSCVIQEVSGNCCGDDRAPEAAWTPLFTQFRSIARTIEADLDRAYNNLERAELPIME